MDRAVDDDLLYEWVARRHPTPEPVEDRVRAARRRRMLIALPLALAVGALMIFTDVLPEDDTTSELPAWRSIAGLVLMGVGTVAVLVTWVRILRSAELRRTLWGKRRTGLWALTGGQRRALLHQVLGKAPVVEEDLPGTRETARAYAAQKPLLHLTAVGGVLLMGAALAAAGAVVPVLAGMAAVTLLVMLPVLLGRIRQAERFLAEHPVASPR